MWDEFGGNSPLPLVRMHMALSHASPCKLKRSYMVNMESQRRHTGTYSIQWGRMELVLWPYYMYGLFIAYVWQEVQSFVLSREMPSGYR